MEGFSTSWRAGCNAKSVRFASLAILPWMALASVSCGGGFKDVPDLPSQTLVNAVSDEDRNKIASAGESATLKAGESFEQTGNRSAPRTPEAAAGDVPAELAEQEAPAGDAAPYDGKDLTRPYSVSDYPSKTVELTLDEDGNRGPGSRERSEAQRSELTTVIESGDYQPETQSLLEAAAATKEKRQGESDKASFVVTDANLASFKNVPLTTANPAERKESLEEVTELVNAKAEDEAYWRERIGGLRQQWKDNVDRRVELRQDILRHRESFYAADDPYYRDSQLKPLWDRALEEFDQVARDIDTVKEELRSALLEGRRKGAYSGWLREGVELEPDDSLKNLDPDVFTEPQTGAVSIEPETWEGPDGQ